MLSTEMRWVDTQGCAHVFSLPVSYRDLLCERLAASYSLNEANLATRLACMIVAMDVKQNGKPFALCRRGLSGQDYENGKPRRLTEVVKALGFTEWNARVAIQALRAIEFVTDWSQRLIDTARSTWALWRRRLPFAGHRGKDWNKSMLRRAANLYVIGDVFVRAAMAERKRRAETAGRKAFLADRLRRRTEIDRQEVEARALIFGASAGRDQRAKPLGAILKVLPDTQLQDKSREELERGLSSLEEGPATLGGKSVFASLNVLAMAMALGAKTKAGDDLSGFLPVGPPPDALTVAPNPAPELVPVLHPVSMPRPWSPLEASLRDLEEAVLKSARRGSS